MSIQEPGSGYALWISPDGSLRVNYSLALFSEIDALVNDGYRRIAHGGIETGGILFGTKNGGLVRIEAYRPIECQHAFGPSFVLSESDLTALREQLAASDADPELLGLKPIGWFIGHTRSALLLSDREVTWFDTFFPQPGSLTVLIKPERFHPTRFGFLVRTDDSQLERDASQNTVILPLSSQAPVPANLSPPPTLPISVSQDDAETVDSLLSRNLPPAPITTGEVTRVRAPQSSRTPSFPSTPSVETEPEPIPAERSGLAFPYARLAPERTRTKRADPSAFGLQSVAILLLAAVLGCIAGYWAYRQLPSPVIPVNVREQNGQLRVEWPAAQTRNVEYAALQVNDGQWVSLSNDQKEIGQAVISAPSGDVKIDLLAKHWLRDSRGIVRYIRTARPLPNTAPSGAIQR